MPACNGGLLAWLARDAQYDMSSLNSDAFRRTAASRLTRVLGGYLYVGPHDD
jgi:hypothetical protein